MKVLIIDDHAEICEMYESVLLEKGLDVFVEQNGLNGVQKAMEIRPDVVLLDIMMPQMDGFAVLENLKNNDYITCKIIVISNLENTQDEEKALSLGADKFLRKSEYTPDQIATEIFSLLPESA